MRVFDRIGNLKEYAKELEVFIASGSFANQKLQKLEKELKNTKEYIETVEGRETYNSEPEIGIPDQPRTRSKVFGGVV